MRAQRGQGRGHGIGGMGVIHKNRRPIAAGGGQLHTPRHRIQLRERGKNRLGFCAAGDGQSHGQQNIFRLKAANQVQPGHMHLAMPGKAQVLPCAVKALRLHLQISPRLFSHPNHQLPPGAGNICHPRAHRIVEIDHNAAIFGQNPGEKPGLGLKIGLECFVIIQMVLAEIGKARSAQLHPIKAILRQPMRRGLHRGMGDAGMGAFGQRALQGNGLGRGMGQGGGIGPLDTGGAQVHRLKAQGHPDLAGKGGHRCFAIGAGHGHHGFGLGAKPQCRCISQCLARVFSHHQRHPAALHRRPCQCGTFGIGQHRHRAFFQRRRHKACAMGLRAGQRGKKIARAHLAAVNGQTGQNRICPASRVQTQLRKPKRVLCHGCWPT